MSKVLVIGCGGVASVAISKCCQVSEVFTELCIASRTKSKCDALRNKLSGTTATKITTAQVDADDVNQLIALINEVKPDLVLCGARGLSSIKYALLGSISTFLLRNTDCDILVVK